MADIKTRSGNHSFGQSVSHNLQKRIVCQAVQTWVFKLVCKNLNSFDKSEESVHTVVVTCKHGGSTIFSIGGLLYKTDQHIFSSIAAGLLFVYKTLIKTFIGK